MFTLSLCPSSISSAGHSIATLQAALKDGFAEAVMAGFRHQHECHI